jgi:hypothetical protein
VWKNYKIAEDEDEVQVPRPCGTFSVYAGALLLGCSELDLETIGEESFHREGEFEPILEHYLRHREIFLRYNELKLEQHFRLSAYKDMPELVACENQIKTLHLHLVAPNGEEVSTQSLEISDFPSSNGKTLDVFISDESVYLRFFPPSPTKT